MYCPACDGYVPSGVGFSECPNCNSKITELKDRPSTVKPTSSEVRKKGLSEASAPAKPKKGRPPETNKESFAKKYFLIGIAFFVVGGLINGVFVELDVSGILRELSRLITLIGFFALIGSIFLRFLRSRITVWVINIVAVVSISLLVFYNVKRDVAANSDYALALKYSKQGKYDEEIAVWSKLLQQNPRDHKAQSNIGQAYVQLNRYDDALNAFESAIQLNPEHAGVDYFNAGVIYASRGKLEKAKAYFHNAEAAGYQVPDEVKKRLGREISTKNIPHSTQTVGDVITQAVNEGILKIGENNRLVTAPIAGPPVPPVDGKLKIGMTPEEVLGVLGVTLEGRKTRYLEDGTKEEEWNFPEVIVTFKDRKVMAWRMKS